MNGTIEARGTAPPTAAPSPLLRVRGALGRVRRRFQLETFDVFGRRVASGDEAFEAPDGYAFSWGTPEEVLACEPLHTELDERERALGARRLELGHSVVLGRPRDGEGEGAGQGPVVFSMWVNPRHVNVPGHVKLRLAPDQAFIYKAYTSPEHRGRKLYQAGMRFVLAELAARDQAQLVGYAHVKKGISRRGLAAVGFEDLGRFRTLDFPAMHLTMVDARLRSRFPDSSPRTGVLDGEPVVCPAGTASHTTRAPR